MPFHVIKEESTSSLQRTHRQSLRSFLFAAELDIVRRQKADVKLVPSIREALDAFIGCTVSAANPTPAPSAQELLIAEAALGCRIPLSFKAFMLEAGSRHAEFWESFWVGPPTLGSRNLTLANLALRAAPVHLPAFFLAFAHDGSGGYYVFDTRHSGPEGEYPVRHWEHEASIEENTNPIAGRYRYFPEWLLDEASSFAA